MSGFLQALPFTLEAEGGYTEDTGGRTMKGITEKVFTKWLLDHHQPTRSIKTITDDEVQAIYHANYWVAAKCDALPWPHSMLHFDCAVNTGVGRATKILQAAVGVEPDGVWGPDTQHAVTTLDRVAFFNNLLWERLNFYYSLGQDEKYKPYFFGWFRRVIKLRVKGRASW